MQYELGFECFTMYCSFSSMAVGEGGVLLSGSKRLSSDQRLSCESVTMGVGF